MDAFRDWLTARPIAHRGLHDGNRDVWENTQPAFDAAVAGGFAIECDVHLTRDGIPVVFHDHDLKRLAGREGLVHETDAAAMTAMTVGTTSDHVPTLDAMLARVAGRVPLVIELKGVEGHDDGLVSAVAARLAGYGGPAAIMSFDHWLIRRFRSEAPGIPAGLTAMGVRHDQLEQHFSMLAYEIDFTSFYVDQLDNPFIRVMRRALNRPVISWTVRTPEQVARSEQFADQMTFEGFQPASATAT
ncbi:glycerophosphodiester phosphodiesterase [Zhengella mangrovi]|uniref:Glycerophosphodiester phosphodiesterase n=1 Tax=Zhengella mangrovi TaxID=1982044 RepID=A0A2G1QHS0_9HYPH|nr:glycerophosphodiester phosphodiesterase [Zhengella mangrovi]PHP65065.1 glycerophosphodiester phosphodiesterase [Zhengella mangrovi]